MEQKLSLGSKFRYGLADMGFARITSAMQFFQPFYYSGMAGFDPALAERKAAKHRFSQHKGLC
jgi:Na+/melibiose symporter-like transporter